MLHPKEYFRIVGIWIYISFLFLFENILGAVGSIWENIHEEMFLVIMINFDDMARGTVHTTSVGEKVNQKFVTVLDGVGCYNT